MNVAVATQALSPSFFLKAAGYMSAEIVHLVANIGSQLQAPIDKKGFCLRILSTILLV
jgi:hypothetical protein